MILKLLNWSYQNINVCHKKNINELKLSREKVIKYLIMSKIILKKRWLEMCKNRWLIQHNIYPEYDYKEKFS